jgi:GNAT superfamily N-acetyltransferase
VFRVFPGKNDAMTRKQSKQSKQSGLHLTIRPVTPDLWPALENLFGKAGASNGCWCMYWRLGGTYRDRPREANKEALRNIVRQGSPPGLLAFDGELPVGWCQLAPRDALPWLDRMRWFQRVDDVPVWAISCFFVRRSHRRQGVMSELVAAAVTAARRARVTALEAYPIDTSLPKSSSNIFVGTAATFARAGFKVVARRASARPIMRHDLKSIAR